MPLLNRWLPRTLLGRIFVLFAACVSLFVFAGLFFVQQGHYRQQIADTNESIAALADIILPTITDSAVIGDYDTIKRTLEKTTRGNLLAHAEFTDLQGGAVRAANPSRPSTLPPDWLVRKLQAELHTLQLSITVGHRKYGTLSLQPSAEFIAYDVWTMTRAYLVFAILFLVPGLILVRIPLKMMVADLDKATRFASLLTLHHGDELRLDSTTLETEALVAALNQVSRELTLQHQALSDSESRKSAILAAGLDCFITIDDAGCIIDFNQAAEHTFGYRAEEVKGAQLGEIIIPPELRAAHQKGMAHWRLTGAGPVLHQRIEVNAMRRSGDIFPVELAVVPFGSGERQYFAGFIRDISERKALERERHHLEAAQRQMVSDLAAKQFAIDQHAIVSITDPEGNIIYANQRLQALSGYSEMELLGSNHRLLKSGLQEDNYFGAMWEMISRGEVWHGEYANRAKDGEIYWVAATIVPMLGEDNRPHQYISIQTDITHQKRTEQQLSLFQDELIRLLDQYRSAEAEIAQRRARELMVGAQIQRTLLFGRMPRQNGALGIATYTQPSQGIDGDFYEFFVFDEQTFDIIIGDVMGKGIPAALMGAAVKKQLNRSTAWLLSQNPLPGYKPQPEEIINDLQSRVGGDLLELESFVTLSYLRIDMAARQAILVDAGHLPVIHVTDGGLRLLGSDNLPVGVLEDERYHQLGTSLGEGDVFFMYSDGITEARNANREEFGQDRTVDLLVRMHAADIPPAMIVQNVRWHVNEFESHADPHDDRTCVALQVARPLPADTRLSQFELPRDLAGLAPLRRKIESAGQEAGFDDASLHALTIAAFEAATNIVRHTPPRLADATLHCTLIIRPRRLELVLHYLGSPFTPHARDPDFSGESEGGFGLYIIRNSVDSVEYSSPVDGICRIRLVKSSAGEPA